VWLELALQKSQEVKATKLLTDLSEEEIKKNLGIM
ncbi:GNAT family N-acetyltransferase, partial [Citrobacter sp. TBCS-15]